MRKANINYVKPGEINGKNIYSISSKGMLMSKGTRLLPEYIKKLKQLGLSYIYIEDEISEGIELQEIIPDELHWKAQESLHSVFEEVKAGNDITNTRGISKSVNSIIDSLLTSNEIIINLTDLNVAEDYVFAHSVNVCLVSIIIGMELGMNDLDLHNLGMGALLHDIGKMRIPPEVLNKPGKLTTEEMDIVKKHSEYGFEILKKCDYLNRNTVYVALGHHEWYNGEGYPNGFANSQIHQFARIASVADVFDAMTSDRGYRKGEDTLKVVNYIKFMSGKQFDGNMVDKFVRKVIYYPNGTCVTLNTKEVGIVVKSGIDQKDRPVVRMVMDPEGRPYSRLNDIDLSSNENLSIVGVCKTF